ncbi:PilZ domain-containing protein [Roseibium hamelinense]|uniref:PilZ domain-containing protein n=1 Tax=Roseibium hamelinense TaxID=150831 RepID=A0A562TC25_9HYPH|nr:PilZ domain-containing protein [Roseibium hamelinense]MTI42244.1 PilZ domain-containing protein [Roseibium hamelinense]TWI90540.1 PilZ domain-containing protein [Roseibium hamelinense]
MDAGLAAATDTHRTLNAADKRRHQRVKVNILGRFMLEDRREYPCQVVDMSPGGMAMITPVPGRIGERVVAYLDHLSRVEGRIARVFEGGFAVELRNTLRKRDKIANVLTWLANRDELNLPEDRRHDRFVPKNPMTKIVMPDGTEHVCRIIDVSLSGAAIAIDTKPEMGDSIAIGKMRARVVRHIEGGIAVEFAAIQNRQLLEQHISGSDEDQV